jgi:signal transduction histidine kinase
MFFFAIAVAMPLTSFLISKHNSSLFLSISWLALCAGTSLFAQMEIKSIFIESTLFWDYVALLAVFLLPAVLYSLIEKSISQSCQIALARLAGLHIVYAVAALVGVSANIIPTPAANDGFYIVTTVTGVYILGVVVKKAMQGNSSARIISSGLGVVAVFIGTSLLDKGQVFWFLRYTPHWALGIVISTFLLMLRLRLFEENVNNRKVLARTWRILGNTGSPVELKQAAINTYQSAPAAITEDKIACFAHEINSPLGTGIMAASSLEQEVEELSLLFQEGAIKKSDLERHLNLYSESADIILANLQSAAEMVRAFRQSAGGQQTELRQIFSVKAHVKKVLLGLKPRLTQAGHQIQLNCSPDLRIQGFPSLLAQVITNLVLNSLFHAYDQGEKGNIVLNIFSEESMAVFEYSDDGKGMNENTLTHIFDPYFTTNHEHGSTGLGLSIVKEIIMTKFGGTIVCNSAEGKGVIFTIRLPIGELRE